MMIFVIVIHVIACLTLIAVILLQAGRGHGLAGGSFGAEMNTVFGTRTAKFMTRATSVCAIMFLVTCLTIDIIIAKSGKSLLEEDIAKGLTQEQIDEMMAKLKDLQDKEGVMAEDIEQVAGEAADIAAEADATVSDAEAVVDEATDVVAQAESVVDESAENVVDLATAAQTEVEDTIADAVETATETVDTAQQ